MRKGLLFLIIGFGVSGTTGGLSAGYISHHVSHNAFVIISGGFLAAVMTFVVYGFVLTKLGK